MLRTNHKRSIAFIVVTGIMFLVCQANYADTPPSIEKLIVNPESTNIPVKTDEIAIVAYTSGNNLEFEWKLRGPGKLDGSTDEPVVYYIPPENIEKERKLATISLIVRDDQKGEATAGVIFNIIGVEAEIKTSQTGDLSKKLSGDVIIQKGSKEVTGFGTQFKKELNPGEAIRIGEESPRIGENVFIVSNIESDEGLEINQEHPTELRERKPIFTDNNLFVVQNGAEVGKFMIDKSGNVGIGTTNIPETQKLRVEGGDIGVEGDLNFSLASDKFQDAPWYGLGFNNNTLDRIKDDTRILQLGAYYGLQIAESGDVRMAIKSGNVGIGTTSPEAKLEVHHPAQKGAESYDAIGLGLVSADQGGVIYGENLNHSIFFRVGRDGIQDVTDYHEYGSHRFFTGGALEDQKERMRITKDGNVGIGTNEPRAQLDVAGTIRGENIVFIGCAGDEMYNCTPKDCLKKCIDLGLRMAIYGEVYAWASAGQDHCSSVWMLHAQHPDKPYKGYPMYHNVTEENSCGRVNTGDVPRIEGGTLADAWNSTEKADCACAGLK